MSGISAWVKAHAWLAVGIALIAGIGLGAASQQQDSEPVAHEAEEPADQPDPLYTGTVEEEPEIITEDPKATFTRTCTYLLGSGIGDYRLIGTSKVVNTGNIGVRVKITFLWNQVGAAPIKKVKEVDVPFGGRKTVRADIPATQEQIDRLQSMPYDDQCKVRAQRLGTFGEPVAD